MSMAIENGYSYCCSNTQILYSVLYLNVIIILNNTTFTMYLTSSDMQNHKQNPSCLLTQGIYKYTIIIVTTKYMLSEPPFVKVARARSTMLQQRHTVLNYSSPPLIKTLNVLLPNNYVLISRGPLLRGSITYIHCNCCKESVSFIEGYSV